MSTLDPEDEERAIALVLLFWSGMLLGFIGYFYWLTNWS